MAEYPKQPGRHMTSEAREREYLRNLPGNAGAIQRAVWGVDEADYARMVEFELRNAPPRGHIFSAKLRGRRRP